MPLRSIFRQDRNDDILKANPNRTSLHFKAEDTSMVPADAAVSNQQAVQHAIDHWNRGDLEQYLGLYRDDVVLHGYAGLEPGRANVRRFYEAWWQAFPASQLVVEDLMAADDKVACRLLIEGTHTGPFQGIAPAGRHVSVSAFTILRFVDGKCVERWSLVDSLGLLTQIGALGDT